MTCRFILGQVQVSRCHGQSSRSQDENVAKMVGATSSEGFLVIIIDSLLLGRIAAIAAYYYRWISVVRLSVGLSVCLSMYVCWSRSWALRKPLNRSRCRLGLSRVGPRNHVLDRGQDGTNHSPTWGWQYGFSLKFVLYYYIRRVSLVKCAFLLHCAFAADCITNIWTINIFKINVQRTVTDDMLALTLVAAEKEGKNKTNRQANRSTDVQLKKERQTDRQTEMVDCTQLSITPSLVHCRLKIYLFTNPSPVVSLPPPELPSRPLVVKLSVLQLRQFGIPSHLVSGNHHLLAPSNVISKLIYLPSPANPFSNPATPASPTQACLNLCAIQIL